MEAPVKTDSPITPIREPYDIAGLRIVVGASTNQEQIVLSWNVQNIVAGLKTVQPQYYYDASLGRFAILCRAPDAFLNPTRTARTWRAMARLG
jgi:polar amino acid transport system substrate-binding protein